MSFWDFARGYSLGSLETDAKEATMNSSLASIEGYLNQLETWAVGKYNQKPYWLTHQTFGSNIRPIISGGLRGTGAGIQATTLVAKPATIIDALRGMAKYKIHAGAEGFAHRGSDGLIVIMVTGRTYPLRSGQNPNIVIRGFLEDESRDYGGDTLPSKYIMGGFIIQSDGAVKLIQNPKFAG